MGRSRPPALLFFSSEFAPVGFANVLRFDESQFGMKADGSHVVQLKIEDKSKYDGSVTYIYAGDDPAAAHKPITVYKEKNASAYLVAGRYAGFTETHLKYKPLTENERKLVVEKLGSGKVIRFLE